MPLRHYSVTKENIDDVLILILMIQICMELTYTCGCCHCSAFKLMIKGEIGLQIIITRRLSGI